MSLKHYLVYIQNCSIHINVKCVEILHKTRTKIVPCVTTLFTLEAILHEFPQHFQKENSSFPAAMACQSIAQNFNRLLLCLYKILFYFFHYFPRNLFESLIQTTFEYLLLLLICYILCFLLNIQNSRNFLKPPQSKKLYQNSF